MTKRTLLTYFSSASNGNSGGSASTPNTNESTNAENRLTEQEPKRTRVEFRFSDIVGDPGNRKPIEHYASEIRDQVKRAYALGVQLNQLIITFLVNGKVVNGDPFKQPGMISMIGWSIVCQRMQHFACIVVFSLTQGNHLNLAVMCLLSLVIPTGRMWDAILEVIEIVKQDSVRPTSNGGAFGLLGKMQNFDFVFIMFLMIDLLSITDDLSRALQRKDQDIVEASSLIMDVKDRLQDMRDNGWEILFKRVEIFCYKNEIKVPKMEKEIKAKGTLTRKRQKVTNMHFYQVDIFIAAIDSILTEMNHRFNEVSSELLVCMAALNPRKNFASFNVDKLVRLAEIYAEDFTVADCLLLRNQLQSFILNIREVRSFMAVEIFQRLLKKWLRPERIDLFH